MKGAILIDAAHFRTEWQREAGKPHIPPASAIHSCIAGIKDAVNAKGVMAPVRWLRSYYYDSEPFTGVFGGVDYGKKPVALNSIKLLRDLRMSDSIAVRLGTTKVSAESGSGKASFRQKGVDMKIGLDIAWMATKRIVDILVLVTNDADFVAPMKLARTEGVVVGLYSITMKPAETLVEHADLIMTGTVPLI